MLPLPSFYDPAHAGDDSYAPNVTGLLSAASTFRDEHNIVPAINDRFSIEVLAIDLQKEFCHPSGSLFCAGRSGTGAIDDTRRIAEFIYRNIRHITSIRPTLDTHIPIQIFLPTFWIDETGANVAPHTTISLSDVREGKYRPSEAAYSCGGGNRLWVDQYVRHYCESLETAGRYQLYIWPMHCLVGTDGHLLQGAIAEAILFHGMVRQTQMEPIIKGTSAWTENYSAFEPEVTTSHDGLRIGKTNEKELERLFGKNAIVVMGQASSHCVRSSLDTMIDYCDRTDPTRISKIYILRDCMSAVTVRGPDGKIVIDYTDEAEQAQAGYAARGAHIVDSISDMRDWPGIEL